MVIRSSHAILIRAQDAGASNSNSGETPLSKRADLIASFIAKNTDAARNSGGSPTACNCATYWDYFREAKLYKR